MKILIELIILFFIVILPALLMIRYFIIAFGKKGRWSKVPKEFIKFWEILLFFVPFVNWVMVVQHYTDSPYRKKYEKSK